MALTFKSFGLEFLEGTWPRWYRKLAVPFLLVLLVAVLDQWTKYAIRDFLLEVSEEQRRFLGWWQWVWVWNDGVSFGMLQDIPRIDRWLLGFAIVMMGYLGWIMGTTEPEAWRLRLALALMMGGALGNSMDRYFFGAVFDFIDLHWAGYHWPAFNVADTAITLGVVGFGLETLFQVARARSVSRGSGVVLDDKESQQ